MTLRWWPSARSWRRWRPVSAACLATSSLLSTFTTAAFLKVASLHQPQLALGIQVIGVELNAFGEVLLCRWHVAQRLRHEALEVPNGRDLVVALEADVDVLHRLDVAQALVGGREELRVAAPRVIFG